MMNIRQPKPKQPARSSAFCSIISSSSVLFSSDIQSPQPLLTVLTPFSFLAYSLQCRQPWWQWKPHSLNLGPVIKIVQAGFDGITSSRCGDFANLAITEPGPRQ
jgi:hypothetical protein